MFLIIDTLIHPNQVQISSFQVGHAFKDYHVEEFEFNDAGQLTKKIQWTEDDLAADLIEWSEQVLSGYGDYLKVDHANKDQYYQIDLGDNGVRGLIALILFWILCAPIGMVWIAMKYCSEQEEYKYAKVDVVSDSEAQQIINKN